MNAQRAEGRHTVNRVDGLGAQQRTGAAGQGDGDFRAVGGNDVAELILDGDHHVVQRAGSAIGGLLVKTTCEATSGKS